KEQPKVYRNTTGSSSPSKSHVQPKKKYVSNGGSNQSKSSAPKKSTAVPKKSPSGGTSATGKRTDGGDIKNHGGDRSGRTYNEYTVDANDLDGVPWDELNK
ncbi:hypothetical protein R2R70_18990, partial [Cobetia sp. SIMBA_158]